jgi:hypothetical protein
VSTDVSLAVEPESQPFIERAELRSTGIAVKSNVVAPKLLSALLAPSQDHARQAPAGPGSANGDAMNIDCYARHCIRPAFRIFASKTRRPDSVSFRNRQDKASRDDIRSDRMGTKLLTWPDERAAPGYPGCRLDQNRRDDRRFCLSSEPNLDILV